MKCKVCLGDVNEQIQADYHDKCLKALFGTARMAPNIPGTRRTFLREAPKKSTGFSISGVQIKLQARIVGGKLEVVSKGGDYIIKPGPEEYEQFPENEHVSMLIHKQVGIKPPPMGLIPFADGSLAYIIKRYDRKKGQPILQQEDISSMLGLKSDITDTKYHGAGCDKVLELIYRASKSRGEQLEFLKRLLLSYLLGNGDLHLKNTSMIHSTVSIQNVLYKLSPVYDVLSTAVYGGDKCTMCLDFYDAENKEPAVFKRTGSGFYGYSDFADLAESVGVRRQSLDIFYEKIKHSRNKIEELIEDSYLTNETKNSYLAVLDTRYSALEKT